MINVVALKKKDQHTNEQTLNPNVTNLSHIVEKAINNSLRTRLEQFSLDFVIREVIELVIKLTEIQVFVIVNFGQV